MGNFYDELGVTPNASSEEIERAYRFLAQKYHPDKNPGREDDVRSRFIRIQAAFNTLSDSLARIQYDEQLRRGDFDFALAIPSNDPRSSYRPPRRKKRGPSKGFPVWLGVAIGVSLVLIISVLSKNTVSVPKSPSSKGGTDAPPKIESSSRTVPPASNRRIDVPIVRQAKSESDLHAGRVPIKPDLASPNKSVTAEEQPPKIAAAAGVSNQDIPTMQAVPDKAAQEDAEQSIRILFRDDFARARSPEEKSAVALKLYNEACYTKARPETAYMLLRISANLAAESGQCDDAWRALDEIGRQFDIDVLPDKESALVTAAKFAKTPTESKAVVDCWLELARDAMDKDRYDLAGSYLNKAQHAVQLSTDQVYQLLVPDAAKGIGEARDAFAFVEKAKATLIESPSDVSAAHEWGRFLCIYKNDWKDGLPLWAKGNADGGEAAIAQEDLDQQ